MLFLGLVIALAYSSTVQMSRNVNAKGQLIPSSGYSQIVSGSTGYVRNIYVKQGQAVEKGQLLLKIESADAISGQHHYSQIIASVQEQQDVLIKEHEIKVSTLVGNVDSYRDQVLHIEQQLNSLHSRIAIQSNLIELSQNDINRVKPLSDQGFYSKARLNELQSKFLQQTSVKNSLEQEKFQLELRIEEIENLIKTTKNELESSRAILDRNIAELEGRRYEISGVSSFDIKSPISGKIDQLFVHSDQSVDSNQLLVSVYPEDYPLIAEIWVPANSIGFLDVGQPVSIHLDAFPFQRFGSISATVQSISEDIIFGTDRPTQGIMIENPQYRIVANIEKETLVAYGREFNLRPGLTFEAKISTERQSLLKWIMDPLYAAHRN